MIASYSGNAHGEISTNYTTYGIYYGTQLKRTTILDILIKNVNGQIITNIYRKPTDT